MIHDKVYDTFIKIFPQYADSVSTWFQNGKNSIRVRIIMRDYIFTYYGDNDWKFETVDRFLKDGGLSYKMKL